jgi:aspartate/methionine/tyrosine aminotransferase
MTTETLNQIKGVRCNEVMGSMYAFPRVSLPDKAIQEAAVRITVCLFTLRCYEFDLFAIKFVPQSKPTDCYVTYVL